jgi:hypothetical protein
MNGVTLETLSDKNLGVLAAVWKLQGQDDELNPAISSVGLTQSRIGEL